MDKTHVNKDVLTNREVIKFDRKEVDYDQLEEKCNLFYKTWRAPNKDYIAIKVENDKLLEENSQMNALC